MSFVWLCFFVICSDYKMEMVAISWQQSENPIIPYTLVTSSYTQVHAAPFTKCFMLDKKADTTNSAFLLLGGFKLLKYLILKN